MSQGLLEGVRDTDLSGSALDRHRTGTVGAQPGEEGGGVRDIEIESEMFERRVVVGPLESVAVAGLAGSDGAAGVAGLLKFGSAVQIPEGKRALQVRKNHGAHTDLRAFGWDESGNRRGGRVGKGIFAGDGLHRLCGTSAIVAVKTEAALQVELGAGPRAEN